MQPTPASKHASPLAIVRRTVAAAALGLLFAQAAAAQVGPSGLSIPPSAAVG